MLFTIGHSTRGLQELIGLLRSNGIARLVDVRRYPVSRRYPWFNEAPLRAALAEAGIEYVHNEGLGGRRSPREDSPNGGLRDEQLRGYADHMQTPEFAAALEVLLSQRARTCVMCAEADPARCHRSLLADSLLARGVAVVHIVDDGEPRTHTLTRGALVENGIVTYPPPAALPFEGARSS